jgi:hypothetical protein
VIKVLGKATPLNSLNAWHRRRMCAKNFNKLILENKTPSQKFLYCFRFLAFFVMHLSHPLNARKAYRSGLVSVLLADY